MRITPAARHQLLELVAELTRRDPERAARFVLEIEHRLADVSHGLEPAPELDSVKHSATAAEGCRLYLRERTDGMWLIAVWPEPDLRRGTVVRDSGRPRSKPLLCSGSEHRS